MEFEFKGGKFGNITSNFIPVEIDKSKLSQNIYIEKEDYKDGFRYKLIGNYNKIDAAYPNFKKLGVEKIDLGLQGVNKNYDRFLYIVKQGFSANDKNMRLLQEYITMLNDSDQTIVEQEQILYFNESTLFKKGTTFNIYGVNANVRSAYTIFNKFGFELKNVEGNNVILSVLKSDPLFNEEKVLQLIKSVNNGVLPLHKYTEDFDDKNEKITFSSAFEERQIVVTTKDTFRVIGKLEFIFNYEDFFIAKGFRQNIDLPWLFLYFTPNKTELEDIKTKMNEYIGNDNNAAELEKYKKKNTKIIPPPLYDSDMYVLWYEHPSGTNYYFIQNVNDTTKLRGIKDIFGKDCLYDEKDQIIYFKDLSKSDLQKLRNEIDTANSDE